MRQSQLLQAGQESKALDRALKQPVGAEIYDQLEQDFVAVEDAFIASKDRVDEDDEDIKHYLSLEWRCELANLSPGMKLCSKRFSKERQSLLLLQAMLQIIQKKNSATNAQPIT